MSNEVKRSYTALRQFEFCERQFYYRRILGLPEPPSIALGVGILYHECLEHLCKEPVTRGQIATMLAKAKATPIWADPGVTDDVLIDEIAINLARVQREILQDGKGLQIKKSEFWGTTYCAKIDVLAGNTPVVDSGRIVEFVDRPCVVDWKTKGGAKKRSQYATDLNPQLALYCLDVGVNDAAIIEIPRNPKEDLNVITTQFDQYELSRWGKFFDAQFDAMNSRGTQEWEYKLAYRGHGLCSPRWCPYWDRCPGGK